MDIVTDLASSAPPAGGSAVTIGAYDGVHLGHRALLAELAERARADGLTTAVVTFDRHPASVVRPESAPKLLCDLDQKLELLASAGVDRTVVVRFDEERANETAEDFVARELVEGLDARLVVVGEDFHFGHGRKGNVALLREMGSVGRLRRRRGVAAGRRGGRTRDAGPDLLDPDPHVGFRRPGRGGRRPVGATASGPGRGGPRRPPGRRPSWASRRPTSTCRWASACPGSGSTPAGTSGPTDRAARRPCRSAGAPPSTGTGATCWSRPSCSTSPAISTARRPRCPSCPVSATNRPSSTSRSSSPR